MRTQLIIGLIVIYVLLGVTEIKSQNIATGVAAFLLGIVNGLLFFASGK